MENADSAAARITVGTVETTGNNPTSTVLEKNGENSKTGNTSAALVDWSNKCTCAENSRKFKKIGCFVHFSLFYKVKNFRK